MWLKIFLSYFLFLISYSCYSQTNVCHVRISLLTCSPGEDLYSTFGHSALRITDTTGNSDIVYNYGTFNFDEPGFYTKFVRGKLLYYLSTEDFSSFKRSYEYEKRSMIEQVLNLNCNEKQKMVEMLAQNLMGENKFYTYDFLFDNCTTRLRDLLEKTSDSAVHFSDIVKKKTTFRQHIFEYMDYNDKLWTKLGMDILLGNNTDAVMNNREAMFLPDYLLKGFDSGKMATRPVVQSKGTIIDLPGEKPGKNFLTGPVFIFWFLFVAVSLLSRSKNKKTIKFLHGFDGFIFFLTGFAGLLMLVMWFGTDHVVCRDNYNLLWAWPTHAIAAFFINSRKKWPAYYFTIAAVLNILVLIVWYFLPQQMNPALIPFILLLMFRSIHYGKQPAVI